MARKINSIVMWKRRLVAEFIHDKKKGVILLVLLVLAIFFVGKLLVNGGPDEATAAAGPGGIIVSAENPVDPEAYNQPGKFNLKKSDTHPPKRRSYEITRDIFLPNTSVFPVVAKKIAAKKSKADLLKNERSMKDLELELREKKIKALGATLHLKSTIAGRFAIINDTVLGPGGVINGFRIIEINSQACVVEQEGVKLKLKME
jgi:hypothetical protein